MRKKTIAAAVIALALAATALPATAAARGPVVNGYVSGV